MSVCGLRYNRAPGHSLIRSGRRARFRSIWAFTLIELLVVIAIIAILAAILFPVFACARDAGKQARCAVQLKQLAAAFIAYADDNSGRFVPAASDMDDLSIFGGHWRWHGYRETADQPFDPRKGPIYSYTARSGGLKVCPLANTLKGPDQSPNAYEAGCGGYGYNHTYVGGTYRRNPWPECVHIASLASEIARPSRTILLSDAASAQTYPTQHMVEESFLYPPFIVWSDTPGSYSLIQNNTPSMHFRHGGRANVAWCDGHATCQTMTFTRQEKNAYGADNRAAQLGWFGPDDNSLFDEK